MERDTYGEQNFSDRDLSEFWLIGGVPPSSDPNLEKKNIQLLDAASFHKILRKIYFVVKPLKKGLKRGVEILTALFL